jgi:hypothetical protein
MKFSTLFLAAASFAGVSVSAQYNPANTCDSRGYDLKVGNNVIGRIVIVDDELFNLQVDVIITGDLTPNNQDDNLLTPVIELVHGTVCCPDVGGVPGECIPFSQAPLAGDMASFRFTVQEPQTCLGQKRDVTVKADLVQKGGMDAFNALFPQDVEFYVTSDDGDTATSNYLDATFVGSTSGFLEGKKFDGYCVDLGHTINTGSGNTYFGRAMSTLEADFANTQIDKPENLDAVAYCINHWSVGTTYTATVSPNSYKLTSGTMQRAIWYIIDNQQADFPGTGTTNDAWARYIKDDCLAKGDGFVPGCDDLVPVVIIPNTGAQYQLVQTTFVSLSLPCNSATALGTAEALCEPGMRQPPDSGDDSSSDDGTPGSSGDPHFRTWTGDKFDYHGECDLVLVDNPAFSYGLGLRVHIRTARIKFYSYIESIAVRIGEETLEFHNDAQHFSINGEKVEPEQKGVDTKLSGFVIRRYKEAISIRLDDQVSKARIDLLARKIGFPTVHFDGDTTDIFQGSLGLIGEWGSGKKLARDGTTEMNDPDATEFALEWQVRDTEPMLFQEARFPQFPTQCVPPKMMMGTRLGMSHMEKAAEEACANWKQDKEECVFDVLATRDIMAAEVAGSMEA